MTESHDKSVPTGGSQPLPCQFHWIVLLVFLLNTALVAPALFPAMKDINVWDDAEYMNEGRELTHGKLPLFTVNPLVAGLYALAYLPVQSSPFWLIHVCSIGRMVNFALLWLAAYLVAMQLAELATPFVMIALLLMSPALARLVDNGSNALFAAMAGFALSQLLAFLRNRDIKHLWFGSLFLGLAALSRNEGPVLFVIYLGIVFATCFREGLMKKAIVPSLLPFLVLVGGYVFVYGLRTGDFELGNSRRAYQAFEQGQGMAFTVAGDYVAGGFEAQRLFGTGEENHYSVFAAVRRNPAAYLRRIPRVAIHAAQDAIYVYGQYFGLLCFAFAVRGVIELVQKRSLVLLASLLLWSGYAILYVLLCYQPSHLLMLFLTVFSLAAVGVSAMLHNTASRRERYLWSIGLLIVAAASAVKCSTPNMSAATLAVFFGLWIVWLIADSYRGAMNAAILAGLTLLLVALLVRFGFPYPKTRNLGSEPDEAAALYLRQHFKPATPVGAWAPGNVWLANMTYVQMCGDLRYMKSAEDLIDWVTRNNVAAIYVDRNLRESEVDVWGLIQIQIGKFLTVAFTDEKAEVQVLVPVTDQ